MFVIIKMQNNQLHVMWLIIKLPKCYKWALSRCFVLLLSGFQTRGELTSHLLTALFQPLSFVFSCADRFHLGLFSELSMQKSVAGECCSVLNSVVTSRRGANAAPEPPCCKRRALGRTAQSTQAKSKQINNLYDFH